MIHGIDHSALLFRSIQIMTVMDYEEEEDGYGYGYVASTQHDPNQFVADHVEP